MITSLLTLPPLLVYVALFALIAGESAGIPLPGETSLIAAGALAAHHGGISIAVVIAVAAAAAIIGDNIGFQFGRHGGRWLLTRDGRWANARHRYLERGEQFFECHGPKAVFLARWLPGLRVVGAWLAGTHHMRWRSFLVWNALGGIAWAISVGIAAYLLGEAAGRIFRTFGIVGIAIVVAAAVVVVAWQLVRSKRLSAAAVDTEAATPSPALPAREALEHRE
jgi:membrane-associated protein